MVPIHRSSLYAGSITWKIYPWEPVKCGLYKQVVFICHVVFRAGLTVCMHVYIAIYRGE